MGITNKTIVKRSKSVIFKELDDNVYILDPKNTTIHTLNETASFIWRITNRPISIGDISERICDEFDADEKRIAKDVKKFVERYLKQGYLDIFEK